jgi:hypothetical protein
MAFEARLGMRSLLANRVGTLGAAAADRSLSRPGHVRDDE